MKKILTVIFAGALLAGGSVSIASEAPRSEEGRLIAQISTYKHIQAMKWQRGGVVGTVSIKVNTKTGDTYYNERKLHVQDNPYYNDWDDSSTDPRSKYRCVALVNSNSEPNFHLYFNY